MRYSIVGANWRNAEDFLRKLPVGTAVTLIREPDNPHDRNAVMVWVGDRHVGYIAKAFAAKLAPKIDMDGRDYPVVRADQGMAVDSEAKVYKAIDGRYAISPNSAFPQVEVL